MAENYIHNEWCRSKPQFGKCECDCYVAVIKSANEHILILRRLALDILEDYNKSAGKYIDVTELQFMPGKEDRWAHLADKIAKYRERILCEDPEEN